MSISEVDLGRAGSHLTDTLRLFVGKDSCFREKLARLLAAAESSSFPLSKLSNSISSSVPKWTRFLESVVVVESVDSEFKCRMEMRRLLSIRRGLEAEVAGDWGRLDDMFIEF
jgi:hypothetical protein